MKQFCRFLPKTQLPNFHRGLLHFVNSLNQVSGSISSAESDRSLASESAPPVRNRIRFFDFNALHDEQELKSVLERLGPRLTTRQLAAAFHRLKELAKAPQNVILDQLTDRVVSLNHDMSASDIMLILNSCVRLRFRSERLLNALVNRLMQREVKLQLNGALIASILVSMGLLQDDSPLHLRNTRPGESTQFLYFELAEEMSRIALTDGFFEGLKTQEFTQMISGFGMLRFHNPKLKLLISEELMKEHRLLSMKYQDLVYTWKAISQLQIDDWLLIKHVSQEIIKPERIQGFKVRELEIILLSIKPMKYRPRNLIKSILIEITRPDRMSMISEMQLTNIIQTLGVVSYRDEVVLEQLLQEVMKPRRLNLFTKTELSLIAYSFKKLKFSPVELMERLISEVEGVFLDSGLSDEHLLSFILGPRKSELEEESCNKLLKQLLVPERLRKLSDLSLSGLLAGLYERKITDPDQITPCISEIQTRLKSASAQVLSYFAYGLRTNKIEDPQILQTFVDEVIKEEKLKSFNAPQLTGVVYALEELVQIHRINEVSEKGLANLITSLQHTGLPLTHPCVESVLTEAVESSRLLKYSERSLMSMINSFGRMRVRQKEWSFPLFNEVTKLGRLARLSNEELAELVYNTAQMRIRSGKGIDDLKNELKKSNRLTKFTNHDFANLIYAIGICRITDHDFVKLVIDSFISKTDLTTLKNSEIANIIHGLATLGYSDENCLMKILPEALQEERLAIMTNSEFASLVYGLFQLQTSHPRFTRILINEIEKPNRLVKFTNHQLTYVAVSLMNACSNLEHPVPAELITELSKIDRVSRFEDYQLVELVKGLAKSGSTSDRDQSRLIEIIVDEIKKPERRASMSRSNLTSISRHLSEFGFRDHVVLKSISDDLIDRFLKSAVE
eukprot:g1105.t1